jgi:hypothetical protein
MALKMLNNFMRWIIIPDHELCAFLHKPHGIRALPLRIFSEDMEQITTQFGIKRSTVKIVRQV